MPVNWLIPDNILEVAAALLGWLALLFLLIRQYRRQEAKPRIWKMLLAAFVGLFSFSFTIPLFGQKTSVAILPLGAWILYFLLRHRSWPTYRKFAWIGFLANYILLTAALLSGFAHGAMYARNDPTTYLADLQGAKIVGIHPSAREVSFNEELFADSLDEATAADMSSMYERYLEARQEESPYYEQERFPYALLGAKASWGSGLRFSVYLEDDGKGLLLATADHYYYYRSEKPLLEWGAEE